jgi:hypothetical protein
MTEEQYHYIGVQLCGLMDVYQFSIATVQTIVKNKSLQLMHELTWSDIYSK